MYNHTYHLVFDPYFEKLKDENLNSLLKSTKYSCDHVCHSNI